MPSAFSEEDCRREDDELELQWAAIERLPTYQRLRTAVFGHEVVDVAKLGDSERRLFVDGLLKAVEEDNLRLLQKLRKRVQRVGLELPTVEVRYQNLRIEADSKAVHGESVPTLWNALKVIFYNQSSLHPPAESRRIKPALYLRSRQCWCSPKDGKPV